MTSTASNKGRTTDKVKWGLIGGSALGLVAALLSENVKAILNQDPTVSVAIAGASVGLLAVIVAVIALVLTFRTGSYAEVIRAAGGIESFLEPFNQVALLSAGATLVSLGSLLIDPSRKYPGGAGSEQLQVTMFGICVLLFVWAVVATVRIVYLIRTHTLAAAETEEVEQSLMDQKVANGIDDRDREQQASAKMQQNIAEMLEILKDWSSGVD